MRKKHYRITLFPNHSTLAADIAILAAQQNGIFDEERRITLIGLDAYFKLECDKYPTLTKQMQTTIVGETKLILDKGLSCELEIEEVEILDLVYERDDLQNISFK